MNQGYYHVHYKELGKSLERIRITVTQRENILPTLIATIMETYSNLPQDSRPKTFKEQDIKEFCCFFLSFLSSYNYQEGLELYLKKHSYCDEVLMYSNIPYFTTKKLKKSDKKYADLFQAKTLTKILKVSSYEPPQKVIEFLAQKNYLQQPLAAVTYAEQLILGCKGEPIYVSFLVLWRRFAWSQGSPKKDFVFDTEVVLNAEKQIKQKITDCNIFGGELNV
ncbi:hypothetical protein [Candidatus Uabimicrobium sp. HlEnr_7]|uniref:hypothetical protein n=1 Tax=Candidatus Uabimicrobium helgolandensis TaxID=3095367 RepID=UPI003555D5F1